MLNQSIDIGISYYNGV